MAWLTLQTARQLADNGTQNIEVALALASANDWREGLAWYSRASAQADSVRTQVCPWVDHRTFVGIVAIVSPNNSWDKTIAYAADYFCSGNIYATQAQREKIRLWLQGEWVWSEKTGPKILSFFSNLNRPRTSLDVTVDRHAIRAWLGATLAPSYPDRIGVNHKTYNLIAESYRTVARQYNILPSQLQAIVWLYARREL
jgi:hypothetical protein